VRVADGGHRVAGPRALAVGAAAEEAAQQRQLGDGGVLVLVEEHDGEPRPLRRAHLRRLGREAGRERHLVAEVDEVRRALARRELLDEVHEPAPQAHRRQQLAHRPGHPAAPARGQRGDALAPLVGERADLLRRDEVLGERARQAEDRRRHRARREVGLEVLGPGVHDVVGDLPAAGVAEHPGRRLHAEAQRVLRDERGRVGVVRRHCGRDERAARPALAAGVALLGPPDAPTEHEVEGAQPPPDALRELAGRLAGEGQAEHAVALHQPVRDEVHDARRHRLRLARARTRDDEHRLERRLDDGHLLRRRLGQAEQARDLHRAEARAPAPARVPAHAPTTRPASCSGHDRCTAHVRHRSPADAVTAERHTASATSATRSAAQAGSASSASGGWSRVVNVFWLVPT